MTAESVRKWMDAEGLSCAKLARLIEPRRSRARIHQVITSDAPDGIVTPQWAARIELAMGIVAQRHVARAAAHYGDE